MRPMTDHSNLRALAEAATPGPWKRTRDNGIHAGKPSRCIGSMYDSEYVVAASPSVVIGLLDEIDRLEHDNDRLMVTRVPVEVALAEDQALRQQLAAMTAARDEACDIATSNLNGLRATGLAIGGDRQESRIGELRKAGQP